MHATATHSQPATATECGFSDLQAIFLSGSLQRSPEMSPTQGLIESARASMEKHGVAVVVVRPLDPVPTTLC